MRKLLVFLFTCLSISGVFAQTGVDTLHYRKIYYFGGTGLSFPLGKTKQALKTKLFSGSAGLDIALKDPRFFLTPTLYMLTFGYDQLLTDPQYNYMIENGRAGFYMLSLSAGRRHQSKNLNSYVYAGPAVGLLTEPRGQLDGDILKMSSKRSFNVAAKIGVGGDYKFPGFFIGLDVGYLHNFQKVEGNPVQFLSIMVGLKSDITRLSEKVTNVIGVDTYKD